MGKIWSAVERFDIRVVRQAMRGEEPGIELERFGIGAERDEREF